MKTMELQMRLEMLEAITSEHVQRADALRRERDELAGILAAYRQARRTDEVV